jgi:hypothetical protein
VFEICEACEHEQRSSVVWSVDPALFVHVHVSVAPPVIEQPVHVFV